MQFEFDLALFRASPPDAQGKPRQIVLDGHVLAYRLRRARRRTVGLTVTRDGLTASAPRWVSIADIEAFIREKEQWVFERIAERERNRRPPFEWRIGARLPVLDREHEIVCSAGATAILDGRVAVASSLAQSPSALRETVLGALKHHALDLFATRVRHFAAQIESPPLAVRLSNARTRWGSCHSDGRILLNWRLVHFRLPIIDYVVAHEIAHLREMNHSPRFWRVVEHLYPDFRAARRELHERGEHVPDL